MTLKQERILAAIAKAKGKRRLDVKPTREQLIEKAVANFIEDCMDDEDLREAILTVCPEWTRSKREG